MSEDLSHDAHLRTALRHAPDHALTPPSSLSQAILAAARRAHRPASAPATEAPRPVHLRPARASRLRTWWLTASSPRWAGGLATGLVAVLGLGLWLELGEVPPIERPAAAVVAREASRADAPTAPAAPSTPSAQTEAAVTAAGDASARKPAPAAAAQAPSPERAPTLRAREPKAAERRERVEPASRASANEPTAANRPRDDRARQAVAPEAVAPPAATAPAPPARAKAPPAAPASSDAADTATVQAKPEQAPAVGAASPSTAGAMPRSAAPAATAKTVAPRWLAPNASDTRAEAADRRAAEAASAGAREREATAQGTPAASPALTLLRRARAEIEAGSARWTWQPPTATSMQPFDDAGQAWLVRVVQAARGRWVDVADRGAALAADEVRWWRDGWPHATLRIEAEGLRWLEPNGRVRYAPLDAAALQALRTP